MLGTFVALILSAGTGEITSPTLPAEPSPPKTPDESTNTSTNETLTTNKTSEKVENVEWEKPVSPTKQLITKERGYRVKFTLENGTEIIGWINPITNSFSVVNEMGGVRFNREVEFDEVKEIKFLKWKPFSTGGNEITGFLYMFSPSNMEITLRDGTSLNVIDRVSELMKFDVLSRYGKTTLFSYFGDYWIQTKRGYFVWKNSGVSDPIYPTIHPHPKTLVKMEFLER